MHKLQELHKEIIEFATYTDIDKFGDSHVKGINKASKESSELTKNIAIEFNNWFSNNVYEDNRYGLWYLDEKYTTEELFNLFIEEKYGK